MNNKKLTLNINIEQPSDPVCGPDVTVTGNFSTENPMFIELAEWIGNEHRLNKYRPQEHLDLLEQLEILCKKARGYAEKREEQDEKFNEIKALEWNDKMYLEGTVPHKFYDAIMCIGNNLFSVVTSGKWGLISGTKELIPPVYCELEKVGGDWIQAQKEDKIFIYNTHGDLLLHDLEDVIIEFSPFVKNENFIWAKRNGKWALFNHLIEHIIPFRLEYDYIKLFYQIENKIIYIKVYKDGQCGLINGILNFIIVPVNPEIKDIHIRGVKDFVITYKSERNPEQLTLDQILKIEEKFRNQN